MVYLSIKGSTLLVILLQQFFWAKHFFLIFWEFALVEVVLQVNKLLCCEAMRLLIACLFVNNLLTIVPPITRVYWWQYWCMAQRYCLANG